MALAVKTRLRELREEFQETGKKVSQETMARKADITLQAYRNVENGGNTSFTTATSLLEAFNSERQVRGMDGLTMDDLGLKIV